MILSLNKDQSLRSDKTWRSLASETHCVALGSLLVAGLPTRDKSAAIAELLANNLRVVEPKGPTLQGDHKATTEYFSLSPTSSELPESTREQDPRQMRPGPVSTLRRGRHKSGLVRDSLLGSALLYRVYVQLDGAPTPQVIMARPYHRANRGLLLLQEWPDSSNVRLTFLGRHQLLHLDLGKLESVMLWMS